MSHRVWQERNDNVPGYCYLIEAVGVSGIIPGRLMRRCKIGLSRNPQARLEALTTNQPPCEYVILRTIYVQDMALVEGMLHEKFKHCQIKLERSREWFSLNPWQFQLVWWAFDDYSREYGDTNRRQPAIRGVVAALIALTGFGILVGTAISPIFKNQPEMIEIQHKN